MDDSKFKKQEALFVSALYIEELIKKHFDKTVLLEDSMECWPSDLSYIVGSTEHPITGNLKTHEKQWVIDFANFKEKYINFDLIMGALVSLGEFPEGIFVITNY